MRRWRALVIVTAMAIAVGAGAVWGARAQVVPPSTSTTQSTAPPRNSSTTTRPIPTPRATTTAPPPPRPTTPPPTAPPGQPPPATTTTTTIKQPPPPPPDVLTAWANQLRDEPGYTTSPLVDAVRGLEAFGLTPKEAMAVGFGHFPVAGPANYSDDWGMPRFTPVPHTHKGTDIFAAAGTPVRAAFDGVVRFGNESVGGMVAYLEAADGNEYYMAHLSAFARDVASGSRVKQGTTLAFVGNTGNAAGGATHCHFEVHPNGGAPVDPKPVLDRWVRDALADIDRLVASYEARTANAIAVAGFLRQFDVGDPGLFSAPAAPPTAPALWASAVNPVGSSASLAAADMASLMEDPSFADALRRAEAHALEVQRAHGDAVALLTPLMSPALAGLYIEAD